MLLGEDKEGRFQTLTRPRRSVVTIASSRKYTPTHGSAWTVLLTVGCIRGTWVLDGTGWMLGCCSGIIGGIGPVWDETDAPRNRVLVLAFGL